MTESRFSTGQVSGFVLAGGRSSRMGTDKALLNVAGQPLIRHALELLAAAGISGAIAGARSDLSRFAPVVPDTEQEKGPLSGLSAALNHASSVFSLFIPVDMPLMPPSLLHYLTRRAMLTGHAVTLTSVNGFAQTFPVVLRACVAPMLQKALSEGRSGCFAAFKQVAAERGEILSAVPAEFLAQCGVADQRCGMQASFWYSNVNSPTDLARLQSLIA